MEYFLVIGIEYKKYKQSAELSVFLDDRLVDDFTLDKDYNFKKDLPIEEKWYHELGMHNRLTSKNWKNAWDHTCQPTFYKCYKVPGNKLNDKLTIEVRNSNSNYTNGFMTKSSTMRLPIIALFPVCMVDNRGEKLLRTMIKIDDGFGIFHRRAGVPQVSNHKRWGWPCVNGYNVDGKLVRWDMYRGGSFTAELNIRSRMGWKYLTFNDVDFGYPYAGTPKDLMLGSCTPILNMYSHEDQRSNNTKN